MFLCECFFWFFLVCVWGGGEIVCLKKINNNNVLFVCLGFFWGVVRLFVGLLGEGCLFFLGGFRVSVCADVKINTIVKFKNLYILQLLSTL